tara:strand:+ start:1582 stop:2187 length:606 start_codon:yes stop_codon:yes gene_type:complete
MTTEQNLINLNADPINLFKEWFEEAKKTEINDPNAMNIATISSNGKISSRIVLLKSYSDAGFIFYTNSNSKKGKSIENNTYVALNFHWKSLQKQVRIEGIASIISASESDDYYKSRPFGSRIGAWASLQSQELTNRSLLVDRVKEYEKQFENSEIIRPPHWNGYLVNPDLMEFWQDMPFRLHDRAEFIKQKENWASKKLYP